jgi:hypothetical protein
MGQHLVRAGVAVSPYPGAILIPSKLAEISTLPRAAGSLSAPRRDRKCSTFSEAFTS